MLKKFWCFLWGHKHGEWKVAEIDHRGYHRHEWLDYPRCHRCDTLRKALARCP